MQQFENFIGKRFGFDEAVTATTIEAAHPQPTSTEEVLVSDTPANRHIMNRFCQVQ